MDAPLTADQQKIEDQNFVDAAIRDGRITQSHRDTWLTAMAADRQGTKRVITSNATAADKAVADPTYQAWQF